MIINATHGGSNLSDHQRAVKKARLFSHTPSFFIFLWASYLTNPNRMSYLSLLALMLIFFFKCGHSLSHFRFIFVLFTDRINLNWKQCRCARDSNLGSQNGRRRRIHWSESTQLLKKNYFIKFISISSNIGFYKLPI